MVSAQSHLRRVVTLGAAVLLLSAPVTSCHTVPALLSPTSTPTLASTPTATPTSTLTPTPTPTVTPTSTPTPPPLALSVRLEPEELPQGQLGALVVETSRPATVIANVGGESLPLFEEGGRWYGLIGIWAATQPSARPVVVGAVDPLGGPDVIQRYELRITAQQFVLEAITMPQSALNLVADREEVQREAQLVAKLIAPYTPQRLWQAPFQQPLQGRLTSPYGARRSYNGGPASEYHSGLDIAAEEGTPVAATNDGHVVFAGPLKVRGNTVIIDHGWGLFSGYYHLSAVTVAAGQDVQRGETIGLVGSTGFSSGPHLHWSIWVGSNAIDPACVLGWQLPD
jgi:murein DD-endopeptidase MepM/ murein hydrolase activator NlpD